MTAPNEDDERTVVKPALATAVHASAAAKSPAPAHQDDGHALPIGTRLDEFEITHRIGEGGFSIVYLAWDHSLERRVALKEYLPLSIAARGADTAVRPRSEKHRATFEAGLKSFINEGKLLAQFDHPSLVKVYRFWEANGTAYMIMPFYEGVTLRDAVRAMPEPPDEAWLLELLGPLTQALAVIHQQQCYHRDIAPDNIILLADTGRPLLLDFGAARRVIGDMTQALTVILKPGYAPVEQYDENPGMKQGPWTDVYALAAVLHWVITGKTPPPSVGRMMRESYVPLTQSLGAAANYSTGFLQAIDSALQVMPAQRTPNMAALQQDLGLPQQGVDDDGHQVTAGFARTAGRPQGPTQEPTQGPTQARTQGRTLQPATGFAPPQASVPTSASASRPVPSSVGPSVLSSGRLDVDVSAPVMRTAGMAPATAPPPPAAAPWGGAGESASSTASDGPARDPNMARRGAHKVWWLAGGLVIAGLVTTAALRWATDRSTRGPATDTPPVRQTVPALPPATTTARTPTATPTATPTTTPTTTPTATPTTPPAALPSITNAPAQSAAPQTPPVQVGPPVSEYQTPAPADALPVAASAPATSESKRRAARTDGERRTAKNAQSAECGRIMQRLSLGETDNDLQERFKALGCR
jgi:serine/threonine protein kinase